jgi:hypothetical protein
MPELIDIDAAKAYVGFNADVDSADLMDAAHATGNRLVYSYLGWNPAKHTATETVHGLGTSMIQLSRTPIASVESVVVEDGASPPLASLKVDGRHLFYRGGVFPRGLKNVTVRYSAGYSPVPHEILQATRIAIKAVWTAMTMEANFTSHQVAGVEGGSFHEGGPGSLPPAAKSLLNPHRLLLIATP